MVCLNLCSCSFKHLWLIPLGLYGIISYLTRGSCVQASFFVHIWWQEAESDMILSLNPRILKSISSLYASQGALIQKTALLLNNSRIIILIPLEWSHGVLGKSSVIYMRGMKGPETHSGFDRNGSDWIRLVLSTNFHWIAKPILILQASLTDLQIYCQVPGRWGLHRTTWAPGSNKTQGQGSLTTYLKI